MATVLNEFGILWGILTRRVLLGVCVGDPTPIGRFDLPSTADLATMRDIKAALAERLEAGQSIHLGASQVEEPSTALIQLIEAAAISYAARDLQVGLVSPSDALCQAYEDLGLFGALMARTAAGAEP
jgi:anti-anti-sigma regulatory factor